MVKQFVVIVLNGFLVGGLEIIILVKMIMLIHVKMIMYGIMQVIELVEDNGQCLLIIYIQFVIVVIVLFMDVLVSIVDFEK